VQSYDNFHVWVSDILTGKPKHGVRCSVFRPFDNFKDTLRRGITRLPSSPLITSGGLIRETCETNNFGLGELNVEDLSAFSMIAESGYDSVVIETLLPVAPAG